MAAPSIVSILESVATDDCYDDGKEGGWAYFSVPTLATEDDNLNNHESPLGVADLFAASDQRVENFLQTPHPIIEPSDTKAGREKSLKEKIKIFANTNCGKQTIGLNNNINIMEEEPAPTTSSRRSENPHRSSNRRHRNMDDARERKQSDRSMGDDSGKNNPPRSRRSDGGERRSKPTLDSRLDGASEQRSPHKRSSGKSRLSRKSGDSHSVQSGGHHSVQSGLTLESGDAKSSERRPRSSCGSKKTEEGDRPKRSDTKDSHGSAFKRSGTHHSESSSGPSARLKRSGTRTRRSEKHLTDSRDNKDRGDRRMSDNSKNPEKRERRGDRRHSEESGKRDPNRHRHSLDESSRRRRQRKAGEGDARRRLRGKVLRSKDTYIPPPSKGGEDEVEDNTPFRKSGPSDVAPSEDRRSRRTSKRSPFDMPTIEDAEEESKEEQQFETTWQRGPAAMRRAKSRRSLVGNRDSLVGNNISPQISPTTNTRRPGHRDRVGRGANVHQAQLAHMVLLHEEEMDAPTEESDREKEEVPGLMELPEEGGNLEMSEHKDSKTSKALKAAAKATRGVGKASATVAGVGAKAAGKAAGVGAKAAGKAAGAGAKAALSGAKGAGKVSVSAAKGAGKVSVSAAKGAGKAVKGVLGLRRKKKPLAYAEGENSAAGLAFDDSSDPDELNALGAWDAEWNAEESEDMFHGSGGTSLHDSGRTSLH